jgi:hypothetical protein
MFAIGFGPSSPLPNTATPIFNHPHTTNMVLKDFIRHKTVQDMTDMEFNEQTVVRKSFHETIMM